MGAGIHNILQNKRRNRHTKNHTPCVSESNSSITDDHCFLPVGYITNYQFCISQIQSEDLRLVYLTPLPCMHRKGYKVSRSVLWQESHLSKGLDKRCKKNTATGETCRVGFMRLCLTLRKQCIVSFSSFRFLLVWMFLGFHSGWCLPTS